MADIGKEVNSKFKTWINEIINHKWLILLSILFLLVAIAANTLANQYTKKATTEPVADIILNNIPSINLGFLFVYGFAVILAVMFLYSIVYKPKEFHIVLSQFSLLVFIRSIFITLTHLGLPADAVTSNIPRLYQLFTFQNDFFFSFHTALPFLGFLIFRKEKIRWFFLLATPIMAATVLFMHVHYSIDVFAALFIAYGSFIVGGRIFKGITR